MSKWNDRLKKGLYHKSICDYCANRCVGQESDEEIFHLQLWIATKIHLVPDLIVH